MNTAMTDATISRRTFFGVAATVAGAAALVAERLAAQAPPGEQGALEGGAAVPSGATTTGIPGATMSGEGVRSVTLPPKPGATPRLTPQQRDEVERRLSCPCPCTLDVFTCRTSMPCGFSPAMHSDVMKLVEGGYTGDEIIAAFEAVYGEQVLMAPKKEGFNLVGWGAPFAAIAGGAALITVLLRRWGGRRVVAPSGAPAPAADAGATPEELARLERAVRNEEGDA